MLYPILRLVLELYQNTFNNLVFLKFDLGYVRGRGCRGMGLLRRESESHKGPNRSRFMSGFSLGGNQSGMVHPIVLACYRDCGVVGSCGSAVQTWARVHGGPKES